MNQESLAINEVNRARIEVLKQDHTKGKLLSDRAITFLIDEALEACNLKEMILKRK